MASAGSRAEAKLLEILGAPTGLNATLAEVSEAESTPLNGIPVDQMVRQNIAADLIEKSAGTNYPVVQIYCEKLSNTLKEKFRRFSGRAHMVVEVRISQDRLGGLERRLQLYADGVMQLLDRRRGDWGGGLYYTGGYEALFGAVKRGGRNLIQTAKISFDVEVSD